MMFQKNYILRFYFVICLILLLGTACGESTPPDSVEEPLVPTIALFTSRGSIKVGVKPDFCPFSERVTNENGEEVWEGFEIDLAQDMVRRWLGDDVTTEFVAVTADDFDAKLLSGEVDLVIASTTHSKDRDEGIDFSQVYFLDGQRLLIRAEDAEKIENVEDLAGRTIAVRQGSTSAENIKIEANEQNVEIQVVERFNTDLAFEEFTNGEADVFTSDSAFLECLAERSTEQELKVVGRKFSQEPYAIALREGDSEFRELINFTLQAMKQDGTYNALYMRYFSDLPDHPYPEVLPGMADYLPLPYTSDHSKTRLIRIRGDVLVVGVKNDLRPFGFTNEDGERDGFDVKLIEAIAEKIGLRVVYVTVTSANRIDKLLNGEVDILAASMTHTWGRDELIDFSQTYFLDGQSLLVRRDSNVTGLDDLTDEKVACLEGSTSCDNIQEEKRMRGLDIEIIATYQNTEEVKDDFLAGDIDVFTSDSGALHGFALELEERSDLELLVTNEPFTEEPYGMGVPSGDTTLAEVINCALQELKKDGTYDKTYSDFFGKDSIPYPVEIYPDECVDIVADFS